MTDRAAALRAVDDAVLKAEATKYLDLFHTRAYEKIYEAFKEFNRALQGACDMAWAPDVIVKLDDEPYARLFWRDEEAFIEPLYNPVRDIHDR